MAGKACFIVCFFFIVCFLLIVLYFLCFMFMLLYFLFHVHGTLLFYVLFSRCFSFCLSCVSSSRNLCISLADVLAILIVSGLYSNTNLMLELNIPSKFGVSFTVTSHKNHLCGLKNGFCLQWISNTIY